MRFAWVCVLVASTIELAIVGFQFVKVREVVGAPIDATTEGTLSLRRLVVNVRSVEVLQNCVERRLS